MGSKSVTRTDPLRSVWKGVKRAHVYAVVGCAVSLGLVYWVRSAENRVTAAKEAIAAATAEGQRLREELQNTESRSGKLSSALKKQEQKTAEAKKWAVAAEATGAKVNSILAHEWLASLAKLEAAMRARLDDKPFEPKNQWKARIQDIVGLSVGAAACQQLADILEGQAHALERQVSAETYTAFGRLIVTTELAKQARENANALRQEAKQQARDANVAAAGLVSRVTPELKFRDLAGNFNVVAAKYSYAGERVTSYNGSAKFGDATLSFQLTGWGPEFLGPVLRGLSFEKCLVLEDTSPTQLSLRRTTEKDVDAEFRGIVEVRGNWVLLAVGGKPGEVPKDFSGDQGTVVVLERVTPK